MRVIWAFATAVFLATTGIASAAPDPLLQPPMLTKLSQFKKLTSWGGTAGVSVLCMDDADTTTPKVRLTLGALHMDHGDAFNNENVCSLFDAEVDPGTQSQFVVGGAIVTASFTFVPPTPGEQPVLYQIWLAGRSVDREKVLNVVREMYGEPQTGTTNGKSWAVLNTKKLFINFEDNGKRFSLRYEDSKLGDEILKILIKKMKQESGEP